LKKRGRASDEDARPHIPAPKAAEPPREVSGSAEGVLLSRHSLSEEGDESGVV
jgi:hypothetical protein